MATDTSRPPASAAHAPKDIGSGATRLMAGNQRQVPGPARPRRAAPLPPDDGRRRSPHALDLEHYVPAYLTYLANKVSASASAFYRPKFGIGIADWRIMAMLAAEPWIVAARIVDATGMDKGAVSRSLRHLAEAGLVELCADESHGRRQLVALTHKGLALHDRIVKLAIEREQQLLKGLSAEEREVLLGFLMRMRAQVALMSGAGGAGAE